MRISRLSCNRYIKTKDEVSISIINDIDKIFNILEKNSSGETSHNHNSIYYTEKEIDTMLKDYTLKNHSHNNSYYTKNEVLQIMNKLIIENAKSDEICISEFPPLNNEKIWFKIIHV